MGNRLADKRAKEASLEKSAEMRILVPVEDVPVKIGDHGQVVMEIATNIRKMAHVPVQKWKSMIDASWWGSHWECLGGKSENGLCRMSPWLEPKSSRMVLLLPTGSATRTDSF
ncbi:hypothetical protein llap_7404 [Limosa lapponica baueri]|uniref:Uncharacterized protein n=1 Tax=Limosa lapponica baueri TaxID=1758121 RepID=A0A2I0U8B0_LIMLA|nr:hypothetical protein llap_7404 [Limosa lapponica baueri]